MDLQPEEIRFLKSLNAKLKGLGGEVTVTWKDGRIATYALKSENSGDQVYKPTSLDNPTKEVELKD
jgi:hypothetical protein